ncbi:hypothetical protein ASPWEDRAFT_38058 [Aspergillus wentii DTO 134E9]|uniref:Uncharacterized protein n=1 Tax=Aspergillus wentii DTO 134E9 TaxID=1073089 RepID=A0A1L9RNH2_ASPWE|nr:uncharacterized protein ASPWEDRAFT_38058 [Aspergillus wentii DTO 134E9]OJJ36481.1 hypothetical protein ASPWEDRAFT_38058 [Aspergillus wentii DTO 134E9]
MDKNPTSNNPQNKDTNTKPLQNDNNPDLVSHYQARWAKIHDDTIRQIERVKRMGGKWRYE